jgi:hypothetical protein
MHYRIDLDRLIDIESAILFSDTLFDCDLPQIESDEEVLRETLDACCRRPLDKDGLERQIY